MLLGIDYQPSQVGAVRSMDHQLLLKNVVSTKRIAPVWNVSLLPEDSR